MRIRLAKLAVALALAGALPGAAGAQAPVQTWPQRAIKMIVPFPAGGGTDFIARLAAKHLSERLGQQVFVENRAGANGAIGLQALMQSDPDGYTISACSDRPAICPANSRGEHSKPGIRSRGALAIRSSRPNLCQGTMLELYCICNCNFILTYCLPFAVFCGQGVKA